LCDDGRRKRTPGVGEACFIKIPPRGSDKEEGELYR
jgi:hypothetical protein